MWEIILLCMYKNKKTSYQTFVLKPFVASKSSERFNHIQLFIKFTELVNLTVERCKILKTL